MKTKLKELRLENGYTQKDVAEAIGCAASTYAHYEKDERSMNTDVLIVVSKFYKVSIDYLLCNEEGGEMNG